MKIHQIRVNNLNSLYGAWTVNLEESFGDSGLFLIHGPTGAGKSTLMDAVSLALFATTPRLQSVRAWEAVAEEVMSRDTGECFAEVIFSRDAATGRALGLGQALGQALGLGQGQVLGLATGRLRFRATWKAKRAGGSPRGKMQAPQHSLAAWVVAGGTGGGMGGGEGGDTGRDAGSGAWHVLNENPTKGESRRVFREILEGFSVEEFQRAMLLAQGQFDRLLHASPKERAPILELLTNTGEYLAVGARAAKLGTAWKQRLDRLRPDDPASLLSPEEFQRLEARAGTADARHQRFVDRREHLGRVQIWRADGIKRRQKLEIASTLAAQAETSLQDGASDFARLDAFRKARPLLDLLASIRQNEAIERRSAAALHESAEPLEKARAEKTKVEEASRAVRRRLDGARSWAEALEPPLTAWMEARTTHTFATKERDEREARRTTLHLARTAAADTLAIREAELWDAWRAFREIPARPAPLIRPLVARVCAEFLSLLDALPETTQSAPAPPALSPSALSPPEAPTQAEIQAALGAARAAVHAQDAIAQSLRDARTHLVTAEALTLERAHAAETAQNTHASVAAEAKEARAALVATEATLETARARAEPLERLHRFAEAGSALREGEPCPVCGSLEHPAPRLTDALETEYAEANAALGAAEAGRTLARTQADRLDARGGQLAAAAEAASKEHQAAATKEAEARDHWEGIARKAGVDSALSPAEVQAYQASVAAVRVFLDEEVTPATDGLERARFLAVQAREALARAEQELTGQTRAAEEGEAALLGAEARRTAAQAEVLAVWEGFADREASFAQPGGPLSAETLDANPTEPRERILRLIRGLVQEDTDQEMRLRGITRQVTALETDRTEYETRRRDAAAALDEARPRLSQGLSEQGFAGPDELEAQRLPPTEEERIDTLRRRLEKAQSSAATDLINARHELFEHEERGAAQGLLRDETTDVLEARIRAIGHRVTCAEGVRAQRQSKVAIEQDRQQTWKRKNAAYERARVEAEPWLRLRDLIGANNGENFREFAQAQNLGRLLVEANRHLEQLRDRYALRTMVDPKSGLPQLEFEIEDRWRADQRRSIKTLSGGESFLVSLALALGLSGLRTSSMPIETLLLDEGFGTLDPDTLDTALKALERLQGDGRQVGMISHVPGLNERIDRRIRVEPIGQGRSRVVLEVGTALRP